MKTFIRFTFAVLILACLFAASARGNDPWQVANLVVTTECTPGGICPARDPTGIPVADAAGTIEFAPTRIELYAGAAIRSPNWPEPIGASRTVRFDLIVPEPIRVQLDYTGMGSGSMTLCGPSVCINGGSQNVPSSQIIDLSMGTYDTSISASASSVAPVPDLHFGRSRMTLTLVVPEPSTWLVGMVVVGALFLCRLRPRRAISHSSAEPPRRRFAS